MKPIIIIPPDTMSADDIAKLNANELCVVVAKDPAKVKFVDPIPAASQRTRIEDAAIRLSRILLNGTWSGNRELGKSDFASLYVEVLIRGTPLDARGTQEELEKQVFDESKYDELRRLAREEAKQLRAQQKKQLSEPKKELR